MRNSIAAKIDVYAKAGSGNLMRYARSAPAIISCLINIALPARCIQYLTRYLLDASVCLAIPIRIALPCATSMRFGILNQDSVSAFTGLPIKIRMRIKLWFESVGPAQQGLRSTQALRHVFMTIFAKWAKSTLITKGGVSVGPTLGFLTTKNVLFRFFFSV